MSSYRCPTDSVSQAPYPALDSQPLTSASVQQPSPSHGRHPWIPFHPIPNHPMPIPQSPVAVPEPRTTSRKHRPQSSVLCSSTTKPNQSPSAYSPGAVRRTPASAFPRDRNKHAPLMWLHEPCLHWTLQTPPTRRSAVLASTSNKEALDDQVPISPTHRTGRSATKKSQSKYSPSCLRNCNTAQIPSVHVIHCTQSLSESACTCTSSSYRGPDFEIQQDKTSFLQTLQTEKNIWKLLMYWNFYPQLSKVPAVKCRVGAPLPVQGESLKTMRHYSFVRQDCSPSHGNTTTGMRRKNK